MISCLSISFVVAVGFFFGSSSSSYSARIDDRVRRGEGRIALEAEAEALEAWETRETDEIEDKEAGAGAGMVAVAGARTAGAGTEAERVTVEVGRKAGVTAGRDTGVETETGGVALDT